MCRLVAVVVGLFLAPAAALAKPPAVVTAKFAVSLQLVGSYSNKVIDAASSCNATLAEKATFDGTIGAELTLKLASGANAKASALYAPGQADTFTVSGSGWPANDCSGKPVAIRCAGGVQPEQPFHPAVLAFVQGGKAVFYFGLGTSGIDEQEDAHSGTCPDSDVFGAGGPTGYPGVADAVDPYLTDTVTTSLATLARLKKGASLDLTPKHSAPDSGYDVATCNGAADGAVITSCTGALSDLVFKAKVTRIG